MLAGVLKDLLRNVPEDVEIQVRIDGYDEGVGGIEYSEQYGLITLQLLEDDGVEEEEDGDDQIPFECSGSSCSMPELPAPEETGKYKVSDL